MSVQESFFAQEPKKIIYFVVSGLCNFSGNDVSCLRPSCHICYVTTLKQTVTGNAIPIGSKIEATRLKKIGCRVLHFFENSSKGFMKSLSLASDLHSNTQVKYSGIANGNSFGVVFKTLIQDKNGHRERASFPNNPASELILYYEVAV